MLLPFQEKTIPEIAMRMADMPKHNEKRSRMVIITQGSEPTIVVQSKSERSLCVWCLDEWMLLGWHR